MEGLDIINKIISKKEEEFNLIISNKDHLNEKDLEKIEKIISEDNTHPRFVLEYLKLISKFKKDELYEKLEKYKFFLSKKIINENFGEYFTKSKSSSDIFDMLYDIIEKFSPNISINDKISFFYH